MANPLSSIVRDTLPIWMAITLSCFSSGGLAQSTNVPYNADYYHLLDRLEIGQRAWATGFHSFHKPYSRTSIIALLDSQSTVTRPLSPTDRFNIAFLQADNREVSATLIDSLPLAEDQTPDFSRRFFRRRSVAALVRRWPSVDWHINPVIGLGVGQQSDTTHLLTNSTIGLETRGSLLGRIGFYGFFTFNQVRYPRYVQAYRQRYELMDPEIAPTEGAAHVKGTNQLQFNAWRGYLTTKLLKVIELQIGRDRLFLGNGYRSLLLSDTSDPYWFLKLATRLGSFEYMNLYTVLRNTQSPLLGLTTNPPKFMVMHHLSMNLGKHINVGAFEAVTFSRQQLEFNYLNPIILYRSVESSLGSADNSFIGLDLKGKWGGHWLIYSQVMLDEFVFRDLTARQGAWTNKFALQLGAKYINAFGLANFDLQGEMNLARPFTYSHRSGQTNYVHENQPLAHPLGSNFMEGLGVIRYQQKRLQGVATLSLMLFGTDRPGLNYGANVLSDYLQRYRFYGNYLGQGRKTIVTYADLRLSYQLGLNGFIDLRYLYRLQSSEYKLNSYESKLASIALRVNIAYRNWTL